MLQVFVFVLKLSFVFVYSFHCFCPQMSGVQSLVTKLGAVGKPDPNLCEQFAVEGHFLKESRLLRRDVEVGGCYVYFLCYSFCFNALFQVILESRSLSTRTLLWWAARTSSPEEEVGEALATISTITTLTLLLLLPLSLPGRLPGPSKHRPRSSCQSWPRAGQVRFQLFNWFPPSPVIFAPAFFSTSTFTSPDLLHHNHWRCKCSHCSRIRSR